MNTLILLTAIFEIWTFYRFIKFHFCQRKKVEADMRVKKVAEERENLLT